LFFSCCDSVAALALANCNEHVAEANITALAHTQLVLHGTQISKSKSAKITLFSRSGYTRACHWHVLFPVPNCHAEFLTFLRSSPPFFSRVLPRFQAASSRDIAHMQTGQCGNHMGTEFQEVLFDEHGIGGDGEYCGDNDAQLDRINVFYYEASGGTYVPCAVFFDLEPGVIGVVRASPLGELIRPGNLVNHTRGQKWARDSFRRAGTNSSDSSILECQAKILRTPLLI
jgi:hypothetical protein